MKNYVLENYNIKETKLEVFLVIILVLFSSSANGFFNDSPLRFSIIPLALSFFLYLRKFYFKQTIKLGKKSYIVILIYTLYILAYLLKYSGEFDPGFSYRIFKNLALGFFIVQIVGYKFFKIYENIIYVFALISLPLFLLEAVIYNSLFTLMTVISSMLKIPPLEIDGYVNIIIFTMNKGLLDGNLRNCGFSWEPGAFANFLILAIFINLATNNFNLKNKKLIVLLITLFTTFSTTGYLALFIISIWYLSNVKITKTLILLPIVVVSFIYISTLPFMTEKVLELSDNPDKTLRDTVYRSRETGKAYTLGRFAGLLINWKDFKEHPIIGYGGHGELKFSGRTNTKVFSVNGLGGLLSGFGIIGFLLFVFSWYKSSNNLSVLFGFRSPYLLIMIIFILGFSYGIILRPLFLAFQLTFLYLPAYKTFLLEGSENDI